MAVVALAWAEIDVDEDPDEPRFTGDPAELVDAAEELLSLLRRPSWQRRAACRGQGPERWFPERGDTSYPGRAVCGRCEVRTECLGDAVADPERVGIWGGTSGHERRALRRGEPAPRDRRRAVCVDCGRPCTRTRCLACHEAFVAAHTAA